MLVISILLKVNKVKYYVSYLTCQAEYDTISSFLQSYSRKFFGGLLVLPFPLVPPFPFSFGELYYIDEYKM